MLHTRPWTRFRSRKLDGEGEAKLVVRQVPSRRTVVRSVPWNC